MICRQDNLRKLRGRCKHCLRAVSRPDLGPGTITISSYSIGFPHPDVFSVVLESQPSTTVLLPSSLKNIRTSSVNDPVDTRTVGPPAVSPASFDFQPCLPTPTPTYAGQFSGALVASLGVAQQQAGPQHGPSRDWSVGGCVSAGQPGILLHHLLGVKSNSPMEV